MLDSPTATAAPTQHAPETIEASVPPEPPSRSVVIDRNGLAWQRLGACWVRNAAVVPLIGPVTSGAGESWRHLVVDHGPLTLVHVGPERGR